MRTEGDGGTFGIRDSLFHHPGQLETVSVVIRRGDHLRSIRQIENGGADKAGLLIVDLAPDGAVADPQGREEGGVREGVNGRFRDDQAVIIRQIVTFPKALGSPGRKAGEIPVFLLETTDPQQVEVREDGVAVFIDAHPANEP